MCQTAKDHCWSAWTYWPHIDNDIEIWYLQRYCYQCKRKERV